MPDGVVTRPQMFERVEQLAGPSIQVGRKPRQHRSLDGPGSLALVDDAAREEEVAGHRPIEGYPYASATRDPLQNRSVDGKFEGRIVPRGEQEISQEGDLVEPRQRGRIAVPCPQRRAILRDQRELM